VGPGSGVCGRSGRLGVGELGSVAVLRPIRGHRPIIIQPTHHIEKNSLGGNIAVERMTLI